MSNDRKAMKCIHCECKDCRVLDSRPAGEHKLMRRRRQCTSCGSRFTTIEIPMAILEALNINAVIRRRPDVLPPLEAADKD